MEWWQLALVAVLALGLGSCAFLALASFLASRPANLGVTDGQLSACPDKPNCVCTRAADPRHQIAPIPFQGSAADTLQRLRDVVAAQPRARVVTASGNYLHAEFTSLIFRFVDDVEFLIDEPAGVIHFRSASRAGYSDLGVNRARMEALRRAFQEQPAKAG